MTISGLTLTGGDPSGAGGAIRAVENLSLLNSTLTRNAATSGGALHGSNVAPDAQINIDRSTFTFNTATGNGGALEIVGPSYNIAESTISGNSAGGNGGGGYFLLTPEELEERYGHLEDMDLSFNYAAGDGGGMYANLSGNATMDVNQTTVSGNSTGESGGGFFFHVDPNAYGVYVTVENSVTRYNYSEVSGGGLAAFMDGQSSSFVLRNSTITGNTTGVNGGGLHAYTYGNFQHIDVYEAYMSGNYAAGNGGGMYAYLTGYATMDLNQSTISGNTANGDGGGLYQKIGELVSAFIYQTLFNDNHSPYGNGGGIAGYNYGGYLDLNSSVVRDNTAGLEGGGFFGKTDDRNNTLGETMVTDTTLHGNTAANGGGVKTVTFDGGFTLMERLTVSANSAFSAGAGADFNNSGVTKVNNCTVSANTAHAYAGGMRLINSNGTTDVRYCTITGNTGNFSTGGMQTRRFNGNIDMANTIVADNTDVTGQNPDFADVSSSGSASISYSLIGDNRGSGLTEAPLGMPDANGNLIGDPNGDGVIDPLLGPLADNGGPTLTHALLPDSPAINAGDPSAMAGVGNTPEFDQRGAPYGRVEDDGGPSEIAIIDMGAFEVQGLSLVDGDFNDDGSYNCLDIDALTGQIAAMTHDPNFDLTGDGFVNVDDLDAWLVEGGANNPGQTGGNPFLEGDANLNGFVDAEDFITWNNNKFTSNTAWCSGNFNADSVVDAADFLIWNENKFQGSDGASQVVLPSPSANPHEIDNTRTIQLVDATVVTTANVWARLARLSADRVDALFATLRGDERPHQVVIDHFADDSVATTPSRAKSKSVICGSPLPSRMMFDGLRSHRSSVLEASVCKHARGVDCRFDCAI